MSVQFNVQHPRTGAAVIQSLNTTRVQRLLNAQSLNEAQRMGMFDKIKDFFRGGVKAEAIRQLYDQVTAPSAHEAQPLDMLHRFERLRALATDAHQTQFSSALQTGNDEQQGQWTFSFSVGDAPIYRSEIWQDRPGATASEFNQALQMYQGIHQSIAIFRNAVQDNNFPDLGTFLSQGQLSSEDNTLMSTLGAVKDRAVTAIKNVMEGENINSSPAEVFDFVRDLHPVHNPYLQMLASVKYGEVSLLQLCFPEKAKEAELLVKFDKARALLTPQLFADMAQRAVSAEKKIPIRTAKQYALENVQDAIDDINERPSFIQKFDDPLFSRQNFKGIEPGETDDNFKAKFQRDGEPPHVLEFSNRVPSHFEFRGEILKKLLQNENYGNMLDLFSIGLMGPEDMLVMAAGKSFSDVFVGGLKLDRAEDVLPFLQNLQKYGPSELADQTFGALRQIALARTNLLTLWMGDLAPAAPKPDGLPQNGEYA